MSGKLVRKSFAAIIAAAVIVLAFAAVQPVQDVYADDDVIEVSSMAELTKVLSRGSQQGVPLIVRLMDSDNGYSTASTLSVPDKVTLDLNGHTISGSIKYIVTLAGTGASVKNGTLSGGGVRVDWGAEAGSITKLKIKNARDHGIIVSGKMKTISGSTIIDPYDTGIYVYGGKVTGGIKNNTIRAAHIGIRLFNDGVSGKISGNTIANCSYHGISLNGATSSTVCSHSGDIISNKLTNCRGDGISIYEGAHVGKITKNVLTDIGGHDSKSNGDFGIIINAGQYKSYAKEITHNTLSGVTCAGIVVYSGPGGSSKKWQNHGYVSGDIAYNKVSKTATIKKKVNWDKKSKYACEGAIYVDAHAKVKGSIHHNTVNTSYDNGVCVLGYSSVKNINNNTIRNTSNAGISITSKSKVLGTIKNNKISNSKRYGLFVNNGSSVKGRIEGNTISNIRINGIFMSQKSKAGVVNKNTIKNAKQYGVIAGAKSKIATLSNNTIVVNRAKDGIGIISNTGCYIKTIKGNKISGKYNCGIRVKTPTGRVKVLSNTLKAGNPKSKKSTGISVEGCRKGISIKGNKITGNNTSVGIYVKSSRSSIKKNKVRKSRGKVSKA